MTMIDLLCWASSAVALIGGGAYIYGYIIHSKGDRRLHTASLLFTGFGLANLPIVLRYGAHGPGVFSGAVVVSLLLLGMVCQSATAFRGRRSDRRASERRAPAAPEAGSAAPPQARAA